MEASSRCRIFAEAASSVKNGIAPECSRTSRMLFDDFTAAAEWLIENGYTKPRSWLLRVE